MSAHFFDAPDYVRTPSAPPDVVAQLQSTIGNSTVQFQLDGDSAMTGVSVVPVAVGVPGVMGVVGISIVGNVSEMTYCNVTGAVGSVPSVMVPVPGRTDGLYTVTITLAGPATEVVQVAEVSALYGFPIQQVWAPPSQPVPVGIVSGIANPLPVSVSGQPISTQLAVASGVALATAHIGINGASNSTQAVVAGVVGKTITVYGWQCSVNPFSVAAIPTFYQCILSDSNGANIFADLVTWVQTAVGKLGDTGEVWYPQGIALPSGLGVLAKVVSGGANTIGANGALYYTQH